ncbi:transposase [Escherichia coli]|uniref:Transposase n=1 Tax=Escherichia coli TaxID=562 RepID=A0A376L5J1_ECOLX|nr:transposase [Escherichia coli]
MQMMAGLRRTITSLKMRCGWSVWAQKLPVLRFDHGGERGALLYSLIGTCKLNGVEPESYLRYVLDVIADWPINRVGELLPLARSTAD